jgi:hypothetical protein
VTGKASKNKMFIPTEEEMNFRTRIGKILGVAMVGSVTTVGRLLSDSSVAANWAGPLNATYNSLKF